MSQSLKSHERRKRTGFYKKYLSGKGLDIGSTGYKFDHLGQSLDPELAKSPIPGATGIDLDYPGYDGVHLPFEDVSQDFVYSSHMLEHIRSENLINVLREQHRVVKIGGHIVICVPHKFLYERGMNLPSKWNHDHQRMYTPATLMAEVETALFPNSYRVRLLCDNDENYNYETPMSEHPVGEYQIECVLEKIALSDISKEVFSSGFFFGGVSFISQEEADQAVSK